MKNRSRIDIASHMLEKLDEEGPLTRTQIMYLSYISHLQLKEYLTLFEAHDLVKTVGNSYAITKKGQSLRESLKVVQKVLAVKRPVAVAMSKAG